MEREGFVFYRSFYDALKGMEAEMCKACFVALCEYGLNGNDKASDPVAMAILAMARPTIEKNNQMYENGKKGGRAKTKPNQMETKSNQTETKSNQSETKPNQTITKSKPTETETETETVTETETETDSVCRGKEPQRTFVKPTLENVSGYCRERGNDVDAERFMDYYESNGWMVGKNKMKDWKAAVRNWERGDSKSGKRTGGMSAFDELERRLENEVEVDIFG